MTNRWVLGARPRTLPAAVVPVIVGTGLAVHEGHFVWWRALFCLAIALAMQVGVNYANDYSDGIRGTDDRRVGPVRLVASKLAEPQAVKRAAFASLLVGAAFGLVLCLVVNPWLILVGIACIAAAWFYTGGSHPYGYRGLGEVSVFVFFGLVATVGTAYVQTERVNLSTVASACAVGLLAVALLLVNNLRDIPGDTASGKSTLAVRIGDGNTRALYLLTVLVPFAIAALLALLHVPVLLAFLALPLVLAPSGAVRGGRSGRELIAVLGATGRLQLAFGALLALGWVL